MAADTAHDLTSEAALRGVYATGPGDTSLAKVCDHVHPLYRPYIEAAPFAVLATRGPNGLDTSPRGDGPGFVVVADDKTLLLPDRRGNQRIDSLRNVVHDPHVALLFLIPGVGEALRVNGSARISASPALCASLAVDGKAPASVLVIRVASVFFQCARAVKRSSLWDAAAQIGRDALPSPGLILQTLSESRIDGAAYDAALQARQAATLY
ncbi:pyridoxamine 5'-phosphate oxidase family protein [Ideonella lacteola]|uniref:pyridoxamine 5'-phosphate oxidase family protein n=1 Tax=Ideonella lacteola TaxID=2984193 RepID=UPI003BF9A4C9